MSALRFYTAEQLGRTQSLTPDGFLLCEHVPLARTGVLLYADGEVPVEADSEGIIRVIRDAQEVFSPTAVASFAGKPVTNDHPPTKVSPGNWREYAVGVVLNPRRGDGRQFDDDFLFADLLIHDAEAIQDIRDGKREVSAGYDADYEQLRPGEGRQHLIIGNHVALVDKGRCGPRCSIGDRDMAVKQKPAWFDRIMKAHKTGDSEVLVDELEKVGEMLGDVLMGDEKTVDATAVKDEGGVHVHLHNSKDDEEGATGGGSSEILQRLEALERAVAILAHGGGEEEKKEPAAKDKKATKDEKEDKEDDEGDDDEDEKREKKESKDAVRKSKDESEVDDPKSSSSGKGEYPDGSKDRATVGDSSSLRMPWQELLTRAEFLAPGIKHPTFDAKQSARITTDAMCEFRRKVLGEALKEDDTRTVVEQLGGPKLHLAQMTCDAVTVLFNGASEIVRQGNTQKTSKLNGGSSTAAASLGDTVKLINQRNRERFGLKA